MTTQAIAAADAVAQVEAAVTGRRRLPPPPMRRALRESAGVSGACIAEAMGVTRQAVHNWERGIRTPRGRYLTNYLAVLDELARQVNG